MRRIFQLTLLALALATPATARILHVPTQEPDLATALRLADRGDTIIVRPGYYEESGLRLPSGVTIRSILGEGRTIIQGEGEGPVLEVPMGGRGTVVEGLTFQGGTEGIVLGRSELRIVSCRFLQNTETGIAVATGSQVWLDDCEVRTSPVGVRVDAEATLNVAGSRFFDNGTGVLFRGTDARFYRTVLRKNDIALDLDGGGTVVLGGKDSLGNDIFDNKILGVRNSGVTVTGSHNFWGWIHCELIEKGIEGEVPVLPFTNFDHDSTFVECP